MNRVLRLYLERVLPSRHGMNMFLSSRGADTHPRRAVPRKKLSSRGAKTWVNRIRFSLLAIKALRKEFLKSDIDIATDAKRPKAQAGRHIHFHVAPMELSSFVIL